jgi:osmotically-inducible protein OsmY
MGRVAAVEAILKGDPVLAGCVIKVSAQNDLLVLDGEVPTNDAKARAETMAGRVEGVKKIANHLEVKPGVQNPNENTDLNATPQ